MIRKIALAAAAGAVALAGVAAVAGSVSAAPPPTITNATSATIQCNITSKAKIVPALKNNWDQQAHEAADGETVAAVSAIPDTKYNTDGNNSVSAPSGKSTSCTGTATQTGVGVATIASLKLNLSQASQAVDNPPLQEDNTCLGLLAGTQPGDVAASYNVTLTFKTSGNKLAPTTISGLGIAPSGAGFAISGGTLSGSLAGGNAKTQAYIDQKTLNAVAAAPATSLAPAPDRTCEANLKVKVKPSGTTASLKAPKGLKKITVGNNLLPPNQPSNICARKGSVCP